MDSNFKRSVELLLTDETGEEAANDPTRSGNVFGISPARLDLWAGDSYPGDKRLTRQNAIDLYKVHLWDACGCGSFVTGLDYWVFDCGYRFSPNDAFRWSYLALGLDPVRSSKVLFQELLSKRTPRDVILEMDVFVRRRMKVDPKWEVCKHWWTNRANRARDRAVKMSKEQPDG